MCSLPTGTALPIHSIADGVEGGCMRKNYVSILLSIFIWTGRSLKASVHLKGCCLLWGIQVLQFGFTCSVVIIFSLTFVSNVIDDYCWLWLACRLDCTNWNWAGCELVARWLRAVDFLLEPLFALIDEVFNDVVSSWSLIPELMVITPFCAQ